MLNTIVRTLICLVLLCQRSTSYQILRQDVGINTRNFRVTTHSQKANLKQITRFHQKSAGTQLKSSTNDNGDRSNSNNDYSQIQWQLFEKYHAKDDGVWKGIWTTYDYIGDVQLETIASVNYNKLQKQCDDNNSVPAIQQTHTIVVGATKSDCETCFDSMETKELPVAVYTPSDMKKSRLGACGMVNGPSLLRTGAMATELVLSYGNGRVRVVFQHAPVWEKGVEPGSCPPQGLKLFRTMLSRETMGTNGPPTEESESSNPPKEGNPIFYRPVPPFQWHKKWSGTSWTWGEQAGNRGWKVDELGDEDSWHGSAPTELWNLRLSGGIFIQCPRVVTDLGAELFRVAWLPTEETLLRLEAGVLALQPILSDDLNDDEVVGFKPPSLVSYRCDVLAKIGDLEGQPSFVEMSRSSNAESNSDQWQ